MGSFTVYSICKIYQRAKMYLEDSIGAVFCKCKETDNIYGVGCLGLDTSTIQFISLFSLIFLLQI